MSNNLSMRIFAPVLVSGVALALGACSSMTTYGTGTTPAAQTVQDISGILSLGGSKSSEEPIDYSDRAPIVEPPVAGALPPPGEETNVALASDWPVDPDEERKRIDALVRERNDAGQSLKFEVPESMKTTNTSRTRYDEKDRGSYASTYFKDKMKGSDNPQDVQKLFANAKSAKTGSFDANGNPTRQYLTEPPVVYREPDPESPVDIAEKPKKKKNKFRMPDLWPF